MKHIKWILLLTILALGLSACMPPVYTEIRGSVYLDNNRNAIRDSGDTPLSGAQVQYVSRPDLPEDSADRITVTIYTGVEGNYGFVLDQRTSQPGAYVVFTAPEGTRFVEPKQGDETLIDSDVATSEAHYGKALLEFGETRNGVLLIDALVEVE